MDLIVYHGGCPDGWCAAFVAKKLYSDAELFAAHYDAPVPEEKFAGKRVLVVDFSWPREQTEHLHAISKKMYILEHHKSAETALAGLSYVTFDNNKSGARLAWEWCFGAEPSPWYVDYVEDRDLWRHQLPDSIDVNAYLMALPQTIYAWSDLDRLISIQMCSELGAAIRMYITQFMERAVEQRRMGHWGNHSVAMVNAAYMNCSEIGARLCDFADIGMIWQERGDGKVQFELRSKNPGVDVSDFAKVFGGGGHKHAAGFQISSLSQALRFIESSTMCGIQTTKTDGAAL